MTLPINTDRSYEYTDEPETASVPSAEFSRIDSLFKSSENQKALMETIGKIKATMINQFSSEIQRTILPKLNAIFSLQRDILSRLPLKKLAGYDQDNLQDPILDIFYPVDDRVFEKEFYSRLELSKASDLIPLFRERIAIYLRPHLLALKAYSEEKVYIEETTQPETISDLYPILGKYLKENTDRIEILFDEHTLESGVWKKITLSDDLYATYLYRTMAYPSQTPQNILREMDNLLEERIMRFTSPNPHEIEATLKREILQVFQQEKVSGKPDHLWVVKILERIFEESKTSFQIPPKASPLGYTDLEHFKVTLRRDMSPILVIEEQHFGAIQVLPAHTTIGLKLDKSAISCEEWLQLAEKQKNHAQQVTTLEFSADSPWYKNIGKLEKFLNYFPHLESLTLPSFNFQNNRLLRQIAELNNLKELNLEGGQFNEFSESFKLIGRINWIRKVNLSKTNVREQHVTDLASSHSLEITLVDCNHLKKETIRKLHNQFPKSFFHG